MPDDRRSLYEVRVPGHKRWEHHRSAHFLQTLPLHEQLAQEAAEHPELASELRRLTRQGEWCDDYRLHPLVRAHPNEVVYPLSLYLDGVSHSKVDSVLGITISNMVSGTRHLCVALRKSLLCRCGCKGWCSIREIWAFVDWCITALAAGEFPRQRHDGSEWTAADEMRESLQGRKLGFRGAIVQIKADWDEFAKSLGMNSWQHSARPCPFCNTDKEHLFSGIKHWSLVDAAARLTTPAVYEAECASCEQVRTLSQADHAVVLARLAYQKRQGASGRCLVEDVPSLRLLRGDRLEPSDGLPDIGAFELTDTWPLTVVLWRQQPSVGVQHRLPIFRSTTGCTMERLCIDHLHTMNLGVYQRWCLHSLWALIRANAWGVRPGCSAKEMHHLSCDYIRGELAEYYTDLRRTNPGIDITQIPLHPLRTIGGDAGKVLRTKGAEAKCLVGYVVRALERRGADVPRRTMLLEAGQCLEAFDKLVSTRPRNLGARVVQEMLQLMQRYVALSDEAQVRPIPKYHLWLHMVLRTVFGGGALCKTKAGSCSDCSMRRLCVCDASDSRNMAGPLCADGVRAFGQELGAGQPTLHRDLEG